jgi:Ca2+-binding EF-hand superfamily protein
VRLLTALGEEVTEEQAEQIVRGADTSADGLISLEEFATFMSAKAG